MVMRQERLTAAPHCSVFAGDVGEVRASNMRREVARLSAIVSVHEEREDLAPQCGV